MGKKVKFSVCTPRWRMGEQRYRFTHFSPLQ